MPRIKRLLSRMVDILSFIFIFHSLRIAFVLSDNGITRSDIDYSSKNGVVHFKNINTDLNLKKHLFFIQGFNSAKRLKKDCNAVFRLDDSGRILIDIDGIEAFISTKRDLDLIHSIFFGYKYNIIIHRPTVVLDVGMNVGFSALFFARNPM